MVEKTVYTVPTVGIGRKDFSESVQQSVEPLISSYQSDYHFSNESIIPDPLLAVLPGEARQLDIALPAGNVVFAYDSYLSCADPTGTAPISLEVFTFDAVTGAPFSVARVYGIQHVELRLSKGTSFRDTMRIVVTNNSAGALDFQFHTHGFYTSQAQYDAQAIA